MSFVTALHAIYCRIPVPHFTYDHRLRKTGHPVRSAIHKPQIGRLVVGWVTTSEYLLLYVFELFFLTSERVTRWRCAVERYSGALRGTCRHEGESRVGQVIVDSLTMLFPSLSSRLHSVFCPSIIDRVPYLLVALARPSNVIIFLFLFSGRVLDAVEIRVYVKVFHAPRLENSNRNA